MAINPLKAFLYLTGGAGAAVGGAYVTGLVDMLNAPVPGIEAKAPEQPKSAALAPQPEPAATEDTVKPANPAGAPTFEVLRVEPDGSVVIAGRAAPGSTVEVVVDGISVAKGKADAGGDFAVVLEKPLAPGDHQIVLIASAEGGQKLQSAETATVSVPDKPGGEVLAMIGEPGKASEIVVMPAPAAEPAKPAEAAAAKPAAPASADPVKPAALAVAIKAVEIEGSKIFVAGTGQPGYAARIYVDDALLGEAQVQPDGGFVVEAVRDLAVGPHAVRADLVGLKDGAVVARSQVPFEREPGEQVAAVAPAEPAKPAEPAAVAPVEPAGEKPSEAAAEAKPADPAKPAEVAAAAPGAVIEAPKLVPAGNAVIIRKGDTLWRISRRVYGRGIRFSTIYTANSGKIEDPNRIWPGQVFAVPGKTETGEAADMSAVSEQVAPEGVPAQNP